MTDIQTRRKQMKYGLITTVIICIILAPFIFAKTQRNHSRMLYEESLAALHASGFPKNVNDHVNASMQNRDTLDFTKQDQFWDLLQNAENWSELNNPISYTIEKPISLNSDQINWLNESMHKTDADKLALLLNDDHLDKSMFAWLIQDQPSGNTYTFDNLILARIPSLMGVRNYSMYYEIGLIKSAQPNTVLAWRNHHFNNDSLIGAMINVAALKYTDAALAYHAWRYGHTDLILNTIHPKDAYKQCLTGEALLFGNSIAGILNDDPWLTQNDHMFGHNDNPLSNITVYMWGLRDCAEYNNYYREIYAALNNIVTTEIKDIPIKTHTHIGASILPHLVESLRTLYNSSSHQRLCQLSIYLSNYYHQHKTLPTDTNELKTLLPAAHALLAGDRFQFALTYTRPSESSYLLEVDSGHTPDSADMTRIRKIPSIGKHIFMLTDHYLFAEMNYPVEEAKADALTQ